VDHSGGQWCGVAILVPRGVPVGDVACGLAGEPAPDQTRWVEATIGGVRIVSVYVPNGQVVGSAPYHEKLEFLDAAAQRAAVLAARGPVVIAGDMNVAPADIDLWDPVVFAGGTHVTPQERIAHEALCSAGGLVDAFRAVHPDEPGHTWWDYRAGAYHKREGMRIDHVLVSEAIATAITGALVDRNYRKGAKPSDHAPVVVEIADA
jgi:exodeoxyribonuclease-3